MAQKGNQPTSTKNRCNHKAPRKSQVERQLDEYKSFVMKEDELYPERAWDAASHAACDKVEIKDENEEKGMMFHKFSCVVGECKDCPSQEEIIPKLERDSTQC